MYNVPRPLFVHCIKLSTEHDPAGTFGKQKKNPCGLRIKQTEIHHIFSNHFEIFNVELVNAQVDLNHKLNIVWQTYQEIKLDVMTTIA